jgi:peptidoglycan/LPS O-acetylase OafA/YrhL
MNSPIRQRYVFIDTLRGLAACSVVLFHLNVVGLFPPSIYQTVVKHGWLGVTAFFVISGFAVHSSLMRLAKPAAFLSRRFWRIYPPYIASVLLVLVLVVGQKVMTGTNDFISLPKGLLGWLATVTLASNPVTSVPAINWVYWSLSYEAAFYLILSAAFIRLWLRWPVLLLSSVLAIMLPTSPLFFLNGWTYFALGVVIAELNRKLNWQTTLLMGLCFTDLGLNRSFPETMTALVTAFCIGACTNTWGRWLNHEPLLHHVGTWSYSLYLIHVPIGCWLVLRLFDPYPRKLSADSFGWHLLIDLSALAICIAITYGFWRWIEEPSIRGFKSLSTTARSTTAA